MGREISKTLQLDLKKLLFLSSITPESCFSLVFHHNKCRQHYFYKYPQCAETLSFHFVARKSSNIKKISNITYAALHFHLYPPLPKYKLFITKIFEYCNRSSVMIFKNKKERKHEGEGTISLLPSGFLFKIDQDVDEYFHGR